MEKFQIIGEPTCRVVYVEGLFEKKLPKGSTDGEPKYNALIIIPKDDVQKIAQLEREYNAAF